MFKLFKSSISILLLVILFTFFFSFSVNVQAIGIYTPIIAPPSATLKQMEDWAKSKNATDTFISLAKKYWDLAPSHGGIDPVVAYAQAAKETGYGKFGGVIDESYKNPCGLKTTQGGDDNNSSAHKKFDTWDQGVMAHLDHLALYAGAEGYPKKNGQTYDPRHFASVYNTVGNSLQNLGGRWAPSPTYGDEIYTLVKQINNSYYDLNGLTYRLGGDTRYDTAVKVSKAAWSTSDNVILAYGKNFPDALAGVPLAYIKDAPILLTDKSYIPAATLNEITRLKAKNIYILGSIEVISDSITNALQNNNLNVTRIYGMNRFETSVAIGNEIIKNASSSTAILTVATNYPDALSISPYAAFNNYPILFTYTNTLNVTTKNFLIDNNIKKVIIPGSSAVVSNNVVNQLKSIGINVTRISGSNRYETSLNIGKNFNSNFNKDVFISTGTDFPDALTGGVIAAKEKNPVLLTKNSSIQSSMLSYIKSKGNINLYVLGSNEVISDTLVKKIKE